MRLMSNRALKLFVILALAGQLLLQVKALAQADQGRITGTVRDQSNAVVADATVTIKNERTGDTRTTITSEQGLYLVTALKPSFYTISVNAKGFAKSEFTQVQLSVGQELTLDVDLKPEGVTEVVTVI